MQRRVVVTGLGLVTPLGIGKNLVWEKLLKGDIGISSLKGLHEDYNTLPCKVAGFVPANETLSKLKSSRTMSTATIFAVVASEEALDNANWHPKSDRCRDSTGVAVGMGMSPLDDLLSVGMKLTVDGYGKVSPHFIPRILTNLAAGHISIKYGFRGPNHSVSTACATGTHAIGDGFRFIVHGDADVMVCGGTEACICPLSIAGFSRMRALSTSFNDSPKEASRPFDIRRDGFVMGEGAGIVVLEEYEHAVNRNAKIYAEILGYGLSGDGHHVTAPSEDGNGAYLCMKAALRDAKISSEDIGYVNAHATSTPMGDAIEVKAIQRLLTSKHSSGVLISSTKGSTGHLLGAAGSVEAIFTILACYNGVVPPTANLEQVDTSINSDGLKFVRGRDESFISSAKCGRRIALKNSFGFGGTNVSLCFASV